MYIMYINCYRTDCICGANAKYAQNEPTKIEELKEAPVGFKKQAARNRPLPLLS